LRCKMAKTDRRGVTVKVDRRTGITRVDGCPQFKLVDRGGERYIVFRDMDRLRECCRGSKDVAIEIEAFFAAISGVSLTS